MAHGQGCGKLWQCLICCDCLPSLPQVINKKDQGAGKPSALRKSGELPPGAGPEDSAENLGGRRHIKFNEADLEGLLNEEQGTGW
jgi:hypothetical protein